MADTPVAVVAGSAGDIGAAAVAVLAGQGWRVVGVDVQDPPLPAANAAVAGYSGDLTDPDFAARCLTRIRQEHGPTRCLVHAIMPKLDFVETTAIPWTRWESSYRAGIGTLHHLAAAAVDDLKAGGAGASVVVISSIGATTALPGVADYCAVKAAQEAYVRNLAMDLAPYGARANAVSPGFIDSQRVAEAPVAGLTESWHPLQRNGRPSEVAELVAFLASDRASWITGATYPIDGGFQPRPPGS